MANQTQCPNCGGYKTNQDVFQIDPKTGKQPMSGCSFIITGTIVLLIAGVVLSIVAGEEFVNQAMIVGFLLFIGYALWQGIATGQARQRAYILYNYQCNLCGYKWEWKEGQPLPKVTVQPDLIAKGEKLLAEKQQQDMAALHHLTHKNKK
jgi:rubredoxin